MQKSANIPIFVSHRGCPNDCVFCSQKKITGCGDNVTAKDVKKIVTDALSWCDEKNTEIAFFGGSFTGIPVCQQEELLGAAFEFVKNGQVRGIRLSTRPDYIDEEILSRLKAYGVTTIELGAQSMDDEVLRLSKRGHKAADVEAASKLIKEFGFCLGLQMMTGLPGADEKSDKKTARRIIALKPDVVRIYPTLVIENTALATMYESGKYTPQTLDEAVILSAHLVSEFKNAGIEVIRTGLQQSESLQASVIAGPFHPAFGELTQSRMIFDRIARYIREALPKTLTIKTSPRFYSKVVGQKKETQKSLEKLFNGPVTIEKTDKDGIWVNDIMIEI